jgi:hypothetical protein
VLQAWTKVVQEYDNEVHPDRACYYNERTHVGFFSGAVWKSGGVALEEWCTDKTSIDGEKRRGRGDLWIKHGSLKIHLEAKHLWVPLGRDVGNAVTRVEKMMQRALSDSHALKCWGDEGRAGLVFAAPLIPTAEANDASRRLSNWFAALQDRNPNAAIASVLQVSPAVRTTDKYITGGLVLLLSGHDGH